MRLLTRRRRHRLRQLAILAVASSALAVLLFSRAPVTVASAQNVEGFAPIKIGSVSFEIPSLLGGTRTKARFIIDEQHVDPNNDFYIVTVRSDDPLVATPDTDRVRVPKGATQSDEFWVTTYTISVGPVQTAIRGNKENAASMVAFGTITVTE